MITQALGRLGRHSAIYAAGPAVHKLLAFLLLPLVTSYIGSQADYGAVEMAGVTLAIAAQVLGINLLHGMTRFHADYDTQTERERLVSTTLILLATTTGCAFVAAWFWRERGARLLFQGDGHEALFVTTFAILFFQTIGQVGLRWLQILERSVLYGVLTTLKLLLEIGLKVVFLVSLGLGAGGVLYSVLGGEVLVALLLGGTVVARCGVRFSWPMARRLLRYSAPLFVSGLCMFALHQSDRFFVARIAGPDSLGLYALGYKLGTIANMVMLEAFGLIWFPFVFAQKDEGHQKELCRRVLTYFALASVWVSLALAVFARELTTLMAAAEFHESWRVMPIILLAYVFWGVFQVAHTGFYLRQRTGLLGLLVAGAAVVNVALNVWLVPRFGALGAAWATLATFALLAVAAWATVERIWPAQLERGRVAAPIAAAVGLYVVTLVLPSELSAVSIAGKLACIAALPLLLYFAKFLEPREKQALVALARRRG